MNALTAGGRHKARTARLLAAMLALAGGASPAFALEDYALRETFSLPSGSGPLGVLPDGRLVTVVGTTVRVETAPRSRSFTSLGALPGADLPSFGPAFVRVSPDGTRVAVGNNGGASFGNYRVGVFTLAGLSGAWFAAPHFEAAWIDNRYIALTAGDFGQPGRVTVLDTTSPNPNSPSNPRVVDGIGGGSGGVAFDAAGNLFTGNGFAGAGPSGTGAVKAVPSAQWHAAHAGGPPVAFETAAIAIVDVLSAAPLQFDARGNLLVGGGDFGTGDVDYAAVVRAGAVAAAVAGGGPINPADTTKVQQLDPDAGSASNFFSVTANRPLAEIYVHEAGATTVAAYRVPPAVPVFTPPAVALLALGLLGIGGWRVRARRRS